MQFHNHAIVSQLDNYGSQIQSRNNTIAGLVAKLYHDSAIVEFLNSIIQYMYKYRSCAQLYCKFVTADLEYSFAIKESYDDSRNREYLDAFTGLQENR